MNRRHIHSWRIAGAAVALTSLLAMSGISPSGATTPTSVTLAVTPNPINAGDSVLIYGQLNATVNAGQTVALYVRVNPDHKFHLVQKTTTTSTGFYEFVRASGVVMTNRTWYVVSDGARSAVVHEGVAALVSLVASSPTAATGQLVTFSGHVTPSHPFTKVLLQEQSGLNGDGWKTIETTFTGGGSNYVFPHHFALPGDHTVQVVIKGDARNLEGDSDSTTVSVNQAENPSFTINTSSPVVTEGSPVTISGVLYASGSTTTVTPSTSVELYAANVNGNFKAVASTTTGTDGSYSFTESPVHNQIYMVEDATTAQTTADLFQGVRDIVTISPSSLTSTVAGSVTFAGTVTPNHVGHVIFLQALGSDGYWHAVVKGVVVTGSTYSLTYTFGETGNIEIRARIIGGPENVGGVSSAVTIAVNGVLPITSLPPAS